MQTALSTDIPRLFEKAAYWNDIANDPDIRKRLPPFDGSVVNVAPLFNYGNNAGIRTRHGGFILIHRPPISPNPFEQFNTHEIHAFFPMQDHRAERAREDARRFLASVYLPAIGDLKGYAETDFSWLNVDNLVAEAPVGNKGTNYLLDDVGFKHHDNVHHDDTWWQRWLMTPERYLSLLGIPVAAILAE